MNFATDSDRRHRFTIVMIGIDVERFRQGEEVHARLSVRRATRRGPGSGREGSTTLTVTADLQQRCSVRRTKTVSPLVRNGASSAPAAVTATASAASTTTPSTRALVASLLAAATPATARIAAVTTTARTARAGPTPTSSYILARTAPVPAIKKKAFVLPTVIALLIFVALPVPAKIEEKIPSPLWHVACNLCACMAPLPMGWSQLLTFYSYFHSKSFEGHRHHCPRQRRGMGRGGAKSIQL